MNHDTMQHFKGHLLCAIDTETTGLISGHHEIHQIAILPLNAKCEPMKSINPLTLNIIPRYPDRVQPGALRTCGLRLPDLMKKGFDRDKALDIFDEWFEALPLPYTPSNVRKKIIPLGHNYVFDRDFIMAWLGPEYYNEVFWAQYRDTMVTAGYLDDRASFKANKQPFVKGNLGWLASRLDIKVDRAHEALGDCITTAKVYKKLTTAFQFSLLE